jgi:hypothetical protein
MSPIAAHNITAIDHLIDTLSIARIIGTERPDGAA